MIGAGAESARAIEERAAMLLRLRRNGLRDLSVMRAIELVPRELFAPHRFKDLANRNMALPIGCGQTIPSPSDLARRLEALAPQPRHRVLEVGTGSGYGAAVLARLANEIVSLERFETLALEAARRLKSLSVGNVIALFADGLAPSPSLGPFDRISMNVAVEEAPRATLELLAPGGVMVFGRFEAAAAGKRRRASLVRLERLADGAIAETTLGPCRQGAALPGVAQAL
jgi:protein-L-isoaspartate(D-aspartate) O-methyltransferase